MCFHLSNTKKPMELEDRFDSRFEDISIFEPSYHLNGFDYGTVYIIKQDDEDIIEPSIWGMLPEYYSDEKEFRKKFNTLNARSEKALHSKMFSEPIIERRCLILADGFFESKEVNGMKYPHFVRYKNYEPFAFAGIYNEHGLGEYSCSILTTEANSFMAEIHNTKKRMPLILDKTTEKLWIDNSLNNIEILDLIKTGFTKEKFEAYTVSKDLTNSRVRSNHSNILKKVEYEELKTLF